MGEKRISQRKRARKRRRIVTAVLLVMTWVAVVFILYALTTPSVTMVGKNHTSNTTISTSTMATSSDPSLSVSPTPSTSANGSGGSVTTPPVSSGSANPPQTKPPQTTPPVVTQPPISSNPQPQPYPSGTSNPVPNRGFGIAVAATLQSLSSAELNYRLDDMRAMGVGWIRMDFAWNDIQYRDSGHYDWINADRVVAAANARNIKVLGIITYTPKWAREDGCNAIRCQPRNPAEFGEFAYQVASRYAPLGVHSWEIWNEPNMNMQYWDEGPKTYTAILKAAYAEIKHADPASTVITAGLAPAATGGNAMSPIDYLTAMYNAGAKGSFDAVGHHPYSYPVLASYTQTWNAWSQMAATAVSLRSIMIAHGDGDKKIWMTEYGAATGGPGNLATVENRNSTHNVDHVTEELQALMVRDVFALAPTYSWAGPVFWYSYKDLGTTPDTNENFFGLIRHDGSKKPAYYELRKMLGTD